MIQEDIKCGMKIRISLLHCNQFDIMLLLTYIAAGINKKINRDIYLLQRFLSRKAIRAKKIHLLLPFISQSILGECLGAARCICVFHKIFQLISTVLLRPFYSAGRLQRSNSMIHVRGNLRINFHKLWLDNTFFFTMSSCSMVVLIAAKNMQSLRSPADVPSGLANVKDQRNLTSNIKSQFLALPLVLANVILT